ncbi:MAG: hypothetical protein ABEI31_09435 [Halodesulfurarchaeum sp.]
MVTTRSIGGSLVESLGRRILDGISHLGRTTPFWLTIPLKIEVGLFVVLIPFLFLAQDPHIKSLGLFEYLASWTIIAMAIVAAVAVAIGAVLTVRRAIAGLKTIVSRMWTGRRGSPFESPI